MFRIALMLLLAASWQTASATMYKWVDENGETHYTDTLPPQAVNKGTAELNKRGQVIKKTSAALTPEERKAEEEEATKAKKAKEQEEEQKRRDRALLDSYTSEKDFDIARDRNLQATQVLIDSTTMRIKSIQGRLDGLRKQADNFAKKGKPLPPDLSTGIKAAEDEIAHLQQNIEKHNEAMKAIRLRYDSDKKRYQELHRGRYAH